MATIKKSDKDTQSDKKQPKPADDLSSMMAIDDEDLEILNMTERTLVGPATDEEETIAINNKPNVSKTKKEGEEAAKTADMPYQFDELAGEPDDEEDEPEEVEAVELEADEGEGNLSDAIELDEDEPELEIEEEKPAPAPKPAKAAPVAKTDKPAPAPKSGKPAPAPKAEKPAPVAKAEKPAPAPKPGKAAPGTKTGKVAPSPKPEKRKPEPEADEDRTKPQKNPYKIIALISVPVLVALIVLIVLALRNQPQEIQVASSDTASQTIETPASIPATAPQTVPAQPARPGAVPQTTATARPAPGMAPQPQGRPAGTNLQTGAPVAQGAAAVNAAAPARPALPVTQPQTRVAAQTGIPAAQQPQVQVPPQQTPVTQQPLPQASQQPATAAVTAEKIQPPAVPDKNAVHTLKGIDFTESGGTVQMKILLDTPAVEYKCFSLSGPTRVVVDLMGKWNKPPFENKNVSNSRVSRIRIGKDADKVRIVADISGGEVASPTAAAGPDGLVVNITGK